MTIGTFIMGFIAFLIIWVVLMLCLNGAILIGMLKLKPFQIRIRNKKKYSGREAPIYRLTRHRTMFDFDEYCISKWELQYDSDLDDVNGLLMCFIPGLYQINKYGYYDVGRVWIVDTVDKKLEDLQEPLDLEETWKELRAVIDDKDKAILDKENHIKGLIASSNTKFTKNYIK